MINALNANKMLHHQNFFKEILILAVNVFMLLFVEQINVSIIFFNYKK